MPSLCLGHIDQGFANAVIREKKEAAEQVVDDSSTQLVNSIADHDGTNEPGSSN